ncbi:hypothetical protein [Lactococcus lactis]|uniref:hypothetical protein n=1 Tax=Lactococcus lactis TaxID=1358 RepID=UPI00168B63DA|nr:hypothetical protein [Lactococcus lactis]QLF89380.2 hypothetical protein HPC60_01035 [Lactococcus lactis subsp. lactis]
MLPYFHEYSLEEILYIFLQEPRATKLNESSQSLGFWSRNQQIVMLPSEPTKENNERLITYYRAKVSNNELKIEVKNKEIFSYLISQLITKTTNAVKTGAPNQNVLNIYQSVLLTEFEKIHFKFLKKITSF